MTQTPIRTPVTRDERAGRAPEATFAKAAQTPQISLFDFEMVASELRRLNADMSDDMGSADQGDAKRKKALENIVINSTTSFRDFVVGDAAKICQIARLGTDMPNFSDAVEIIHGALKASQHAGSPFRLPPLLLAGPPGIGKSHFVNAVANALQTTSRLIPLNLLDDVGHLVGHSSSWRAARVGVIAQTLIESPTASPIFLGDELDKIPIAWNGDRPIDIFHTLLERENARNFRDQLLDFPIRADWVSWIFTANSLTEIPAPISDRLLILQIGPLGDAQKRDFAERRLDEAMKTYGGAFDVSINDATLDLLARAESRKIFQMIDVAVGIAAAKGRVLILPGDFVEAERLCGRAGAIPRSRQNPKILWVDDAEIIGDRIAKFWPAFGDFFA